MRQVRRHGMERSSELLDVQGNGGGGMSDLALNVLLAAIILGMGFNAGIITYAWLYERLKTGVAEERQRAYRDAYIEAQKKIGEDLRKQQDTREKFREFPQTGQEDIQTYEESLKNLGLPKEKIEKMLADRRKM